MEGRLRRVEDRVDHHAEQLQALTEWRNSIEESTAVNKRMVEVVEALLDALGWVKAISRWIVSVGAALTFIWQGIKFWSH